MVAKKNTKKPAKAAVKKVAVKKAAAKKSAVEEIELKLPEFSDISYAEEFCKNLIAAVAGGAQKVVLDLSDVARLTTPCVQLMISAQKTLQEGGGVLVVNNASEVAGSVFADLGLDDELKEWGNAK